MDIIELLNLFLKYSLTFYILQRQLSATASDSLCVKQRAKEGCPELLFGSNETVALLIFGSLTS